MRDTRVVAFLAMSGMLGCGEYDLDANRTIRFGMECGQDESMAGRIVTSDGGLGESEDVCERAPSRVLYEISKEGIGIADSVTFEKGDLSPADEEKLARPWLHTDDDEVLVQEFWGGADASGRAFDGRRVMAVQASPALPDVLPSPRHELGSVLAATVRTLGADAPVEVIVYVHSSIRPLPLPAVEPRLHDAVSVETARTARAAAALARRAAFAKETESLVFEIESAGGVVIGLNASVRTVNATLPAGLISGIASLALVDRIDLNHPVAGIAAVPIGADDDGSTLGIRDYTEQVAFGYQGENGGSPIIVGVTEAKGLEDEACMFEDTGGCDTTRLTRKYDCEASDCVSVSNYSTTAEEAENGHGTAVTSVFAAGYHQSQTNPNGANEPVLDADWRDLSTGMAPETEVDYAQVGDEEGLADAYDCLGGDIGQHASCREVDVVNSSLGWLDFCDLNSDFSHENALEWLWDDEVLTVVGAGNTRSGTSCRVQTPADTPLAFTVGGLQGTNSLDYDDWGMWAVSASVGSPWGGIDGTFGSSSQTGTISGIDLVADARVVYVTTRQNGNNGGGDNGEPGTIMPGGVGEGTSLATPQVAGAAALITEFRLDMGHTWINQAGFLEVHLLAMGDRYSTGNGPSGCESGGRLVCGADLRAGLGRLKFQKPTTWAWYAVENTFTSTSSTQTHEFSFAIPAGSDLVKCVLSQREPMQYKSNLSLVGLTMKIRDKVAGQCVVDSGTTHWTRGEAYWDTKHHVTTLDSEVNIEGRCADVDIDPIYLSSDNFVNTHTYCYTNTSLE